MLALTKQDGNGLRIFETRILRVICGHVDEDGIWRERYSNELYTVCSELDTVTVTELGRLRWLGQVCRRRELEPCIKLTAVYVHKSKVMSFIQCAVN